MVVAFGGTIPGRVLEQIEERTGQPISDLFHMVAGTSPENIERLERRAEFMLKENREDFNRLLRELSKPKQPREELTSATS
ncbi:MAG: hypothetical protein AMJ69_05580 [Gammaproteobacteria bacterium SG8_47]|nr:MAG: hypothetical protein AMJ69_05580 [Gammaproteobacteria bacterium SG8_47]